MAMSLLTTHKVAIVTTEILDSDAESGPDVLQIIQAIIASCGIITNLIVVVVFLTSKNLRRKIPNMCIINQVR